MLGLLMLLIGLLCVIGGFSIEGGVVSSLVSLSSAMIVFGGTLGAVGLSFSPKELKTIPKSLKRICSNPKNDSQELIAYFKDLAIKIKKEGFLLLEQEIKNSGDKLNDITKKGLQLALDGVEKDTARKILEDYASQKDAKSELEASVFESAGGYSPTLGIIGTVLGLVHILGNLDEPSTLGPKIAAGFIATLYGLSSANLLFLPIANKLKILNEAESQRDNLIIEAIYCLQEGASSNVLEERLNSLAGV